MASAETTTDHDTIKAWVEQRGGRPARVRVTAPGKEDARKGSGGILRIDFQEPDEALEGISWEEFFATFEKNKLAFLYQETVANSDAESRFFKFVERD